LRALTAWELTALATSLQSLTAVVASARYSWRTVDVGWERPHGEVVLVGPSGTEGRGELVAFTPEEHAAFDPGAVPLGLVAVGELELVGYERCAVEAALIDLALRQRAASLRDHVERTVPDIVDVGVCLSFGAVPMPRPDARLKIDHLPGADYAEMDVVVLDYKGKHALVELPDVIFEDPPAACRKPWSLDQSIALPTDVNAAADAGATHINLKAPRMSGFVAAIQAAAVARARGLAPYWGGMWELGVGRAHALEVAALVCPDAVNDIAPRSFLRGRSVAVRMDRLGFGGGRGLSSRMDG
jgi:hypothetical protein